MNSSQYPSNPTKKTSDDHEETRTTMKFALFMKSGRAARGGGPAMIGNLVGRRRTQRGGGVRREEGGDLTPLNFPFASPTTPTPLLPE